jgi:short-subunit dehydrogenase
MGVFNGLRTFASSMRDRGAGYIVNTASVGSFDPMPLMGDYCGSKAAVLALTESLRLELAPRGVGVSALCPGPVQSRMACASADKLAGMKLMDPIWVGRAVVRAMAENRPIIFTHPEYLPVLETRHQMIIAAFDKPAQPGYVGAPFVSSSNVPSTR